MKTIGYLIFAGFYYLYRLFCPVNHKKVFCIMTHDSGRDDNVFALAEYLKQQKEGYTFHYIGKTDSASAKSLHIMRGKLSFFIVKPYHLATASYVLLDNVFLPMAYINFRKEVKLIQLWHGTGTIKRFGQDVNKGRLGKLEKKANNRLTHLIVSSEATKAIYAKAFGIDEDKVFTYGLPRTDILLDRNRLQKRAVEFYRQYPQLAGKRLILYAPTFRDNERGDCRAITDIYKISRSLPDYIILLRLHPHVAKVFEKAEQLAAGRSENLVSVSSYPDINTLLLVADCLITDYSSIIFEYCLLNKPMIFYAYDLEEFDKMGRGFYRNYKEYVPGPVAGNIDELVALIRNDRLPTDKLQNFVEEHYKYLDGRSCERIYRNIFLSQ